MPILLASLLFIATGVLHVAACYVDSQVDHGILAAISCAVGLSILYPSTTWWMLGLIGGALLACVQFLVLAATYLEVPWSVRVLGSPLLIGHVGAIVLLLIALGFYKPPVGGPRKLSE